MSVVLGLSNEKISREMVGGLGMRRFTLHIRMGTYHMRSRQNHRYNLLFHHRRPAYPDRCRHRTPTGFPVIKPLTLVSVCRWTHTTKWLSRPLAQGRPRSTPNYGRCFVDQWRSVAGSGRRTLQCAKKVKENNASLGTLRSSSGDL